MSYEPMKELIEQAEREGKWLQSIYQCINFSPAELRKAQSEGRFCWGPVNWRLIDPHELLRDTAKEMSAIQKHNDDIVRRMSQPTGVQHE